MTYENVTLLLCKFSVFCVLLILFVVVTQCSRLLLHSALGMTKYSPRTSSDPSMQFFVIILFCKIVLRSQDITHVQLVVTPHKTLAIISSKLFSKSAFQRNIPLHYSVQKRKAVCSFKTLSAHMSTLRYNPED